MDWQERYEADDTPWDKGAPAPSLIDLFQSHSSYFTQEMSVMVPGCGLGHDALAIARLGSSVTGIDISTFAVDEATRRAVDFENANFLEADIFGLSEALLAAFDLVWEHTCFCAINPDRRLDYIRSMWRSLKPGGCLMGVFFVKPDVEEGPPFGADLDEIVTLFDPYFTLEWESEPLRFYEGREGRERLICFRRRNSGPSG